MKTYKDIRVKIKRCGICGNELNNLTSGYRTGICSPKQSKICRRLTQYQYRTPNGWELTKKGKILKEKLMNEAKTVDIS